MQAIRPAVEKAKGQPGDLIEDAVKATVAQSLAQVKSAKPLLSELVEKGKLRSWAPTTASIRAPWTSSGASELRRRPAHLRVISRAERW